MKALKRISIRLFFLFGFLMLTSCEYWHLRSVTRDLKNKNCDHAKETTLKMLRSSESLVHHYNLIYVSLCEENLDRALKQMDYVISKQGSGFDFEALFLKAYVLGEMGNVDEALATYQEALVFKPTDIKIKQNMELLLQSNSGKSQKKKKDGKGDDSSNPDEKQEKGEDKKPSDADQTEHDEKQQQQESQQKKSLSQQQIEKIMKEIDSDEKKVRSQGIDIKKSKGQKSEKNW